MSSQRRSFCSGRCCWLDESVFEAIDTAALGCLFADVVDAR